MVPGFLIFIALRRPRTIAQRMPTSAMSLNWVQTATPSLIEVHLFEDANEDHGGGSWPIGLWSVRRGLTALR